VVDATMDGLSWVRKQIEQADTDLLREMVKLFCERVMGEEADAICGAPYGERSDERTNRRNGYRTRTWDTRTGTIDLAVPKLREGSYFPDWLLEPEGHRNGDHLHNQHVRRIALPSDLGRVATCCSVFCISCCVAWSG